MSEYTEKTKPLTEKQIGKNADEEGYKIAKLIRLGNRELERQLNIKKTSAHR
ncbi:MAG: hypothetical protein J1F28_03605 [Oscillospiraceae bacterium]|nr:hypothetical protein [Oscillospiraceae bacterium]